MDGVSPLDLPPRRADVCRLRPRSQPASRLKAELQLPALSKRPFDSWRRPGFDEGLSVWLGVD